MGVLIDGRWVEEDYRHDRDGRFEREPTRFRERVADEPGATFRPESGRYHLYVSYACPWAHRTLIMRALKGLEGAIGVSVVHPLMREEGWELRSDYPGATGDPVLGARYLREVYLAAEPRCSGRVTVPALWDRAAATIVNNESRELLRMLDHCFDAVAGHPRRDYAPAELRADVDATIDALYEPVNNGVYRCGFAASQAAYEEAAGALFAALDHWDGLLAGRRYLCGERLTEADICLYTTLARFDAVYHVHFKCSEARIQDYPNLWGYLRELHAIPAFRETTRLDHIREHYYRSHAFINPSGLVARAPRASLDGPHHRDRLPGADPLADS